MASYVPCKKNDANGCIFYVSLVSQADTKLFKASPTLAAGDVLIAIDDAAPGNLGTLPVFDADFTDRVKVTLSQAETNGDNITIILSDAAGAEWCDLTINIPTAALTFDKLAQAMTGKWEIINNQLIMYDTDGTTALFTYDLTQGGTPSQFNPDKRVPV